MPRNRWLGLVLLAWLLPRPAAAQDAFFARLTFGTPTAPICVVSTGTGAPNGAVTGNPCDTFLRSDGGAGTILYLKETGSATTTGWVAYGSPGAAAAGSLTGATLAAGVLASSLTSVGTLTGGATGAGFTVAFGTSTLTGTVPSVNLGSGTASSTTFLRGDQTWATPAGSGTVTATAGSLTANAIVLGAGTTDTKVLASLGTTTTLLHGNAAGAPTFGAVALTADVSGTLPVASGGLGVATLAAHGLLVGNTTSAVTVTGAGTSGQVLTSNGASADPTFQTVSGTGTVTASAGALTNRAVVLGAGTTDTRVVAGLGTTGQVLTSNGSGADPTFQASAGGSSGGTAGPLSGWTAVNTGSNWTAADLNGGIGVTITTDAASNWRVLTKAIPATPFVISFHYRATLWPVSTVSIAGVYFSDGTKFEGLEIYSTASTGLTLRVLKMNDDIGTGATVAASISQAAATAPISLTSADGYSQLADDGTTLTWSWSLDGEIWTVLWSEGVGSFLTPTTYGFGGLASTTGPPVLIWMRDVTVAP
jgi:hypothetical protein